MYQTGVQIRKIDLKKRCSSFFSNYVRV